MVEIISKQELPETYEEWCEGFIASVQKEFEEKFLRTFDKNPEEKAKDLEIAWKHWYKTIRTHRSYYGIISPIVNECKIDISIKM